MKKEAASTDNGSSLRHVIFIPLALMIASVVSCCFSYSKAKQNITEDLNEAMIAMVNENVRLWTREDTVAALRKMHEATHRPIIYQASDVNFRNDVLKDAAYFTIALVDGKYRAPKFNGDLIVSDSIMLVPEMSGDGLAIQVRGFADCSVASVFAVSDQTVPGILFALSILSMVGMALWRRRVVGTPEPELSPAPQTRDVLQGIKLTPMQRQFAQMLLDAPGMRVDKSTLCSTLWGNKINAEESLYTLVRRTKSALEEANIEIVCNRGDSYELRVIG